jgi:hypothetical protein
VSWERAQDDRTPIDQIRYRVHASTLPGRALARPPVFTTAPGQTSVMLDVSPSGVDHYVVVRAVDAEEQTDGNAIEKSARAVPDETPPMFAGARSAAPSAHAGVTLTWDAATDDHTPPPGIRYVVYDARGGPALGEVEGKTSVTLTDLGHAGEMRRFLVRARDAADNYDANGNVLGVQLGPDEKPPTFAGCSRVTGVGATVVDVEWEPATDVGGASSAVTYEVFVATAPGAHDFAAPAARATGKTSLVVRGLMPSTTYHVVCRARDAAGNTETNTAERSARTRDDATAPTFAGATADPLATPDLRETTLRWTAATDTKTSEDKLVYVVYETYGTAPFDFGSPRTVTAPNATSIVVGGLPSRTDVRWIVRARDEDWNEDTNTVESTVTTQASFSLDVQPFLEKNCAVVGCHVTPASAGGLSMSPGVAYGSLVGRAANQRPPNWPAGPNIRRVEPGLPDDSYLYRKLEGVQGTIVGSQMPAQGTGNTLTAEQKALIRSWILEGAPNN